jgi:carbon storage regulator
MENPGMLVLSRKKSEKIKLGDAIEITVVRVCGNKVRLGIHAPPDVAVLRKELGHAEAERPADEPIEDAPAED